MSKLFKRLIFLMRSSQLITPNDHVNYMHDN
ncbi:hypothetical protein M2369_003313 [Bacillus sp. JUb11]|nr:hypothetical protein [Bacillus sp. JUb11]